MPDNIESIARQLHEANCRNEPEWAGISITHRHVHTIEAQRQRATRYLDRQIVHDPPSDDIGATWKRVAEAGRRALPADDARAPMKALARAFADTVEMMADGAIPNDAGMEFVAVMEARLVALGYRIVREEPVAAPLRNRSCRHGITPDECEFCDSPGADKEEATRQAIRSQSEPSPSNQG